MVFRKKEQIVNSNKSLFIAPSETNEVLFIQEIVKEKGQGKQIFVLNPSRFILKELIGEGAIINRSDQLQTNEVLAFNPGPYREGKYYSFLYEQQVKEVVEYIRLKTNHPLTKMELNDLQAAIEAMYEAEGITRSDYKSTPSNRESVLTTECMMSLISARNVSLYKKIRDYCSFKKSSSSVLQQLFDPQLPKWVLGEELCLFTFDDIPSNGKSKKFALYESLCMIHRRARINKQKTIVILNEEIAIDLIDFFKESSEFISYMIIVKKYPFLLKEKESIRQSFGQIIITKPLGMDSETICSDCGVPRKIRKQFLYESTEPMMLVQKEKKDSTYFIGSLSETIDLFAKEELLC